jgi:hypothetical protein
MTDIESYRMRPVASPERHLPPFRTDPHSSASGLADLSSRLDEVIALFRKAACETIARPAAD